MIREKIDERNVVLDLEAGSKEEVVDQLATLLTTNGFVSEVNQFKKDVFEREEHMTTGIGHNIAIPHGKSQAVIDSTVAVAKLKNEVNWGSLDNQPVNIVFLLAIKEADKGNEHLRVLAELSGKLMDDDFVKEIKESKNKEELIKALTF
ncbi:PTS sugar transporter subunit IIA [Enterococcus thailandicus]|uniref:PTS sugar transporter subunit IIA n=1 Tax=Enterococcus thailandicus TaxID=417368 RepID=UPI00288F8DB6|nr:fructose PTS transporter subunit IIA [Enterococcus thailandicus]MDT2846278.1 fructose PTS transporter subunit IIA [Enterococcus thailandicus]